MAEQGAAPADPFVGQTIDGRYRIEARIGEGGMGVVYRATHVVLKKPLAIKVMRGEQANEPEVVQRFVQEARASSAIGHPNIVNISDFGTTPDGAVYFAMEYLQGQTLGKAMEAGPLERQRAFAIFIQIASALEAAHERGIIHRDLKPENIYLIREPEHPDFVKILDFGIAKVKNAAAKITRTGMVFGTPHYMSPEQAAGQTVDQRTDIYSVGVIMFQVFAGQLPFDAESYMGVMTKHMYEAPPLPSTLSAELRGPIEDVIMKALQKKPEQRYASMSALREDLERAQSGRTVRATPASAAPPVGERTDPSLPRVTQEPGLARSVAQFEGDDDLPVRVPKRRSSLWILLLFGAVLAGIGAFSLRALRGESGAAKGADPAAISGDAGLAPAPAGGGSLASPSGAEPAHEAKPEAKPAEPAKVPAASEKKPKAKAVPKAEPSERPRKPASKRPPPSDPWR